MNIDRESLRSLCKVRKLLDLPLSNVKLDVKHPWAELHSVRPVLVVTDDTSSSLANAHANERCRAGSPYAIYKPATAPGGGVDAVRRRAEEILDAARALSHANAGKTVEVAAEGAAIEPAAWMFFLERPYFSTFTALGDCPVSEGFPPWKELVK